MVELRDVSFRYRGGGTEGLNGISLDIEPGEIVVLAGESGCGKTTLTRCINGLVPRFYEGQFSGTVLIDGEDVSRRSIGEIGRQIGSVFQDPRSQFFTTTSTAEVAFACEHFGFPAHEIRRRVDQAFEDLGIEALRDRSVFDLSTGERQKIAMASVYATRPRLYVLDEPSANLDPEATAHLARIIEALRSQGAAVVIAEHRLHYLAGILDRLVLIRRGEIAEVFGREALHALAPADLEGRGLRQLDLTRTRAQSGSAPLRDIAYFQGHDVSVSFDKREVLAGVSLQASRGEVVGIIGPNGAGKTTFARVATGLAEPQGGRFRFHYRVTPARDRLSNSFFVLQDADYQLYAESVIDELLIGRSDSVNTRTRAGEVLVRLGLDGLADRHPQSLSGGQKQRLTIAAATLRESSVVFLDEPTSGLDAANLLRVVAEIRDLGRNGQVVFVISHDYELLVRACTRIVRIENGVVDADYPLDDQSTALLRSQLIA